MRTVETGLAAQNCVHRYLGVGTNSLVYSEKGAGSESQR